MDLSELKWEWKKKDISQYFPDVKINRDKLSIISTIHGVECEAIFSFTTFRKRIKAIELIIPKNMIEKAKAGSEIHDYLDTFNALKKGIGNPEIIKGDGISEIADIEKIKSVNELNVNKLPKIVWNTKNGNIVHTFIDHWGIIPCTMMVEK